MSTMHCEACGKTCDVDDVERFQCGEDDFFWVCPDCAARINAEQDASMLAAKRDYDAAPLSERNPAQYRREMIEAGRGHLLKPGER